MLKRSGIAKATKPNPARVQAPFDFLDHLGSLHSVGMAPMRMDARAHLRTSQCSRYRALLKIALALAFATWCRVRLNFGSTSPSSPLTYIGPPKSLS
jgi:hypothetical protein